MTTEEIIATIERLHEELDLLIWCITWDYANSARWRLNADELHAELLAEMVHVVHYYADRGKTYEDLRSLVVVSLRHRCRDILAMEYGTHRVDENGLASLDTADGRVDIDREGQGLELTTLAVDWSNGDGLFDLDGFLSTLSEDGRALAKEVLEPGERLRQLIDLSIMRKRATSPKGFWRLQMTPLLLRRAMGWPQQRFDDAWAEVRSVLTTF